MNAMLLPHHRQMLERDSAITPAVFEARGCRSIQTKADLLRLGFPATQTIVPTLLVPIWNVAGEIGLYHHRPDQPRLRKGKPAKYEFPYGEKMVIDVHPLLKEKIRNPDIPLFITEGVKKADAAVSRGLCCIAVVGVWNWRGTNEWGGKTALPDWECIALKGRQVYLCYDSDVMLKPQVYSALVRLAAFLRQRGAHVAFIYLPTGEGGAKMGLDDYFARGHSKEDLLALATTELRKPPPESSDTEATTPDLPYEETTHGLLWHKRSGEHTMPTPLTNFTARIVADVIEDDGAETQRLFSLEASLNGRVHRLQLPAQEFVAMNWPVAHMGAQAILYPGQGTREHARTAIQRLSSAPEQHVRTHTGWVQTETSGWRYCHAGGTIGGEKGADADPGEGSLTVRLGEALSRFALPELPTGEELRGAIRAVLRLWELGRESVVLPVCAAVWRSVFGVAPFSVFLAGQTGVFKSQLAALAQQHFGPAMTAQGLPADWSATDNFLEGLAFCAKDAVLVIDEFVPRGSSHDQQRHHAKADRVLRAQGNNSGRGRMRADGTLRPVKPPRGLILATGEEIPAGHSLRARLLVLEVGPGDIPAGRLTDCQKDAAAGQYARAMAGFLAWIAPEYEAAMARFGADVEHFRSKARASGLHRRTPENAAHLVAGLKQFLLFAHQAGVLSHAEAEVHVKRGESAIGKAALAQAQYHEESEPTARFLELVRTSIASGRAHVAALDGSAPANALACGWQQAVVGTGMYERGEVRSQGERIGFIDEDNLYLLPDASHQCAQRMAGDSGDGIAVRPKTLSKRLHEKGLLLSSDQKRDRQTVRVTACGVRQTVWHLRASLVLPVETAQPSQSSQGEEVPEGE